MNLSSLIIMLYKPINRITFFRKKVIFQTFPKINGKIMLHGNGKFIFGKNVSINSSERSNPIGGMEHCVFAAYGDGTIKIGDNVGISNSAIISRFAVTIENGVKIGGSVKIYDNDFHSLDSNIRNNDELNHIKCLPVLIKKNAFIGAHSIILKGVTIGEGSIIGAGSVVTRNVPSNEIWAGNPASFIRKL